MVFQERKLVVFIAVLIISIGVFIKFDKNISKKVFGGIVDNLAYGYNYLYTPLFEGEIILDHNSTFEGQTYHITDSIRMKRDNDGTFHINAKTKSDAFFGQGFITAQERLFGIEILRRMSKGTLSELKPSSLIVDRLSRTLGFYRIAKDDLTKLDDEDLVNLESFTSGINLYLETMYDKHTPLEFFLGRIPKPEPFKVLDSLAMIRVMAWSFTRGWLTKVMKVAIRQWTDDKNFEESLDLRNLRWESLEKLLEEIPVSGRMQGSNSVVISSKLSASGNSMLESDPHLAVKHPSVWIPIHLIIEDIDINAYGYMISGAPGLSVGFNKNISFGITLSYGDAAEVYLEKIKNDTHSLYIDNTYEKMELIEERIKVKGRKEDHIEKIRITKNGPIISGVLDFQEKSKNMKMYEYSIKLVPLLPQEKPVQHVKFITNLFSSKNWDQYSEVCHQAKIAHLNLMYADNSNIGICVSGNYPIRSEEYVKEIAGGLCLGWDNKHCDWSSGFQKKQPMVKNPEEGFIVSANHDYFGDEKRPYYMGIFRSKWRAERIQNLIKKDLSDPNSQNPGKISLHQLDRNLHDVSLEGTSLNYVVSFAKLYLKIISNDEKKKSELEFIAKKLVEFDGAFDPESSVASLYILFYNSLLHVLLARKGGLLSFSEKRDGWERRDRILMKGLGKKFLPAHSNKGIKRSILKRLWADETNDDNLKKKKLIIERSLELTIERLNNKLSIDIDSNNPEEWLEKIKLKEIHKIRFNHVLGDTIPAYKMTAPGWGTYDSPNMGAYLESWDDFDIIFYPTCRIVVDMGDIENARTVVYPGTSNYLNGGGGNNWMYNGVKHYVDRTTRKVVYSEKDVNENLYSEFNLIKI